MDMNPIPIAVCSLVNNEMNISLLAHCGRHIAPQDYLLQLKYTQFGIVITFALLSPESKRCTTDKL